MKRFAALFAIVLSLTSLALADQPAVLEVTANAGISCYRGKDTTSNGQGVTTPIRQNQNWRGFASRALLLNFDARPIQGWAISKAYLHLYVAKGDLYGIGLTEVLAPWGQPRTSNFVTEVGGPCWLFAHTPKDFAHPAATDWWAWPGSGFSSVSWAHPSARYQFIGPAQIERTRVGVPATEPAPPGKDRFTHLKLPVDPDLVASLAAGACYGLVLTDDKGQVAEAYSLIGPGYPYKDNDAEDPCVFIKAMQEPSLRPRLEVYGSKSDAPAPQPPKDVKVARSDAGSGTVYLEFAAPAGSTGNLLTYDVGYRSTTQPDFTPLPRWSMPRPAAAGAKQVMPVWTLPPGQYELNIRSVDKSGNRSEPAIVPLAVPARPDVKLATPRPMLKHLVKKEPAKEFTLSAVPDLAKVDPVSGAVLYAGDKYRADADYLKTNPVFEGQTVALAAAANEVVAFQLIVAKKADAKKLAAVKVELADLVGPGGKKIAAKPNAQPFRVWYVRSLAKPRRSMGPGETEDLTVRPVAWHGDVCLPLAAPFDETFDLPAADNAVPDQTNQAVWVDLFVPKDTPAGSYRGQVRVTAGESADELPVVVEVLPLTLPDKPTWRVELNCYGGLADFAGVGGRDPKAIAEAEHSFYRLAKAHRQMINALPYHQNGSVDEGFVPPVSGEGAQVKVADWSPWDKRLGPLLDGSAFTAEKGYTGPGAGTPISHIYLPFNENWPLPLEKYYGDYAKLTDRLEFAEWSKKSRPLPEAFGKDYQDGVAGLARQFAEHFKEKGWTGTEFQFFLNNKYYFKIPFFTNMGGHGSSFWLLDEPVDHDDYAANAFFLGLARRGVASANTPDVKFAFRVDNSMPELARGLLNGVCDLEMLGWGAIPDGYVTTATVRQKFMPAERFWHYGGSVSTSGAPVGLLGSFLAGWCSGSDGILPYWTTLRGADWGQADDMAIFYTGRHYANRGKNFPGPLPGLRMKVMRRCQQDIEYLQLLSQAKGWTAGVVRQAVAAYADDPAAPALMFKKLTPDQADRLRAAVAQTLMEMK